LIQIIEEEIKTATGRRIDRHWANKIRITQLNGRNVSNPAA